MMKRITEKSLEMVNAYPKDEIIKHHEQMVAQLGVLEQDKKNHEEEIDKKTEELRKDIEKLEHQIDTIELPIKEQIKAIEEKIQSHREIERDGSIAIGIILAKEILDAGITTKADAIKYVCSYVGGKFKDTDFREVKHERGADIKVWAFKDRWGADRMYYIAVSKGKMVAALKVEKASHRGDTTYTYEYGCRTTAAYDLKAKNNWNRRGPCMREWLNKDLIEWNGMTRDEVVEFWNSYE
jgi:hypothetical protein